MPFDLCKIGQMLMNTREEKGLTLDEVSDALFLRKRVIGAIESGDWDSLPHQVYVKGYVNQYAALLNVIDRLEAEMSSLENQPSLEAEEAATATAATAARVLTSIRMEAAPKGWGRIKKVIAISAMGAVVVGFLVFQNMSKTTTYVAPPAQSVATNYQGAVQTSAKVDATEASTTTQAVEASPTAAEQTEKLVLEPKKLTIACQERTWVRIVIDGAEQKEFMLNPEEVVMLNAKENFDVIVGNAGGVKLFYNGKDTGFTGENGEVKHISLS